MTTRVQTQRLTATNVKPANGSRPAGELWLNFPDLRLGMIDASKAPVDLLAIRPHAATASYAQGDHALRSGQLYVAKSALAPKAFAIADWNSYILVVDGFAPPLAVSGNVSATGSVRSDGGRLVSSLTGAAGQPAVILANSTNTSFMGMWSGNGQITFGATDSAGNPATAYGGFDTGKSFFAVGDLSAGGVVYATKGVRIDPTNSWEWQFYRENPSGDHIQNHRANYYDRWTSNGGIRTWVSNGVIGMQLDVGGNLAVAATVRGPTGIHAASDNSNSLSIVSGRYREWRVALDGWRQRFDGQTGDWNWINNSSSVLMSLSGSGALVVQGNINTGVDIGARSIYATNTVQGAYLYSTGNVRADGAISVGGDINASGGIAANGNLWSNTGIGTNGDITGRQLHATGGHVVSDHDVYAAGGFYIGGVGNFDYGFYSGSGQRVFQYAAGWYWRWDTSNGDLTWNRPGNGNHLVIRSSDALIYNQLAAMGGYGPYANFSDQRGKSFITRSARGLAEILALKPVEFTRISMLHDRDPDKIPPREIGFIAQDVRRALPEAVVTLGVRMPVDIDPLAGDEPSLGITYDTITATLVNAVQELHARIATLEGKPLYEPPPAAPAPAP